MIKVLYLNSAFGSIAKFADRWLQFMQGRRARVALVSCSKIPQLQC